MIFHILQIRKPSHKEIEWLVQGYMAGVNFQTIQFIKAKVSVSWPRPGTFADSSVTLPDTLMLLDLPVRLCFNTPITKLKCFKTKVSVVLLVQENMCGVWSIHFHDHMVDQELQLQLMAASGRLLLLVSSVEKTKSLSVVFMECIFVNTSVESANRKLKHFKLVTTYILPCLESVL